MLMIAAMTSSSPSSDDCFAVARRMSAGTARLRKWSTSFWPISTLK